MLPDTRLVDPLMRATGTAALVLLLLPAIAFAGMAREGTPVPTHHYLYVFPPGSIAVYDLDRGFRLVWSAALPQTRAGVRGAAVHAAAHALFLSYGGIGGKTGTGSLLRYDLVTNRVLWVRHYPFGVDSLAMTPNGSRIFLPTGEDSSGNRWEVIRPRDGAIIGSIRAGHGPHDTVVSLNGRHVYLGGRGDRFLLQASTATDRVLKRIGPLRNGIRPFTITGRETYAFMNEEHLLGFQVGFIPSGKILYTVTVPRFPAVPGETTPSHGLALTPDERHLWLIDRPNDYVHEFDLSGLPMVRPRDIHDIPLRGSMSGKSAWLGMSRDGRYLFVAGAGDVIDTGRRKTIRILPALTHAKVYLEVDMRNGVPVFATPREAVGYRT